jgi:hypothetical protein
LPPKLPEEFEFGEFDGRATLRDPLLLKLPLLLGVALLLLLKLPLLPLLPLLLFPRCEPDSEKLCQPD